MKNLAVKIKSVQDQDASLYAIRNARESGGVSVVSFLNAHAYTMAYSRHDFYDSLLGATVLFRDGIGAKMLLKAYGLSPGYNANGTDLIPLIQKENKDKNFCFIGTSAEFVNKAAETCRADGVKVVATLDGFRDTDTMFEFVNTHRPNILILGMGMPKQELFASYLQQKYNGQILVVNGGAIFDFIAGRFERAPAFFRNNGLEWFYRLLNEPKRLFSRYVIGIPKFMWFLLLAKIRNK